MTSAAKAVPLPSSQLPHAAEVLARAFFDDPLVVYVMPDEQQRRALLPAFMLAGSRFCEPYREIYTTPDDVRGSANWLPPGNTEIDEQAMHRSGAVDVLARIGEQGAQRFEAVMMRFGELHAAAVSPDHWYLLLLGVDPVHQGQGIGGQLMEPILRRADAESRPCYLETMKARNVPFYQKHGFEIVVADEIAGGGPRFWTMRRRPR